MKTLVLIISFHLFAVAANAQSEPRSQFGQDFLHVWIVSAQNTVDVAEAMPEAYYRFQPTDSSKTFGDQIGHIAFTCDNLSRGFVEGTWGEYKDPDTSDMSKAEVIAYLKESLALATQRISAMTDDQANEVIEAFGGRPLKRYITVLFIQDHLANHRAKANLYIRMKGIKPPAYAYFN